MDDTKWSHIIGERFSLQEAQLMLTNPRGVFRGQSNTLTDLFGQQVTNIVSFHMLGILSSCVIVTLLLKRAVLSTMKVNGHYAAV